jgi:hypothetical protein
MAQLVPPWCGCCDVSDSLVTLVLLLIVLLGGHAISQLSSNLAKYQASNAYAVPKAVMIVY